MCSLPKEQSILSREIIRKAFFFSELCPCFDFDFLTSIKHPMVERWHPHAVLLFCICKSVFTCRLKRGFVFNSIAEIHNSVHGKYFLLDNVAPPPLLFFFDSTDQIFVYLNI